MDILKISAVGLITAFCVLLLKDTKNEIAVLVGITGGCIILIMLLDYFGSIFSVLKDICEQAGINNSLLTVIFKIVGIGYIADFSAGIIEDTGSKSLADKVILGGKIIIMVLSLPILKALFDLIAGIFQ